MEFICEDGYLKEVVVSREYMDKMGFNGAAEYRCHYLGALYVLKRIYEISSEDPKIEQLLKETKLDSKIKWFSNNSCPYVGILPNIAKNVQIKPTTVYELCEEFEKIADCEDRFRWHKLAEDSYVFYYCWKE